MNKDVTNLIKDSTSTFLNIAQMTQNIKNIYSLSNYIAVAHAQSKKDFISKMNIALKEAGETDYWLDVIHSAGYFSDEEYTSLDSDNKELLRMLASIVKNSKKED